MDVTTYSRRQMLPFHGMLQVGEVPGGVAESADGLHWKLYMCDEGIVSHTGLPEIRHGSWSAAAGVARARVRGTYRDRLIEETGERLLAALVRHARDVPCAPGDRHELWLRPGTGTSCGCSMATRGLHWRSWRRRSMPRTASGPRLRAGCRGPRPRPSSSPSAGMRTP